MLLIVTLRHTAASIGQWQRDSFHSQIKFPEMHTVLVRVSPAADSTACANPADIEEVVGGFLQGPQTCLEVAFFQINVIVIGSNESTYRGR